MARRKSLDADQILGIGPSKCGIHLSRIGRYLGYAQGGDSNTDSHISNALYELRSFRKCVSEELGAGRASGLGLEF